MKTITIHIDDIIYDKIKKEAALLSFIEGCSSPPSLMEQIMYSAILKIKEGKTELTITPKG
jgi:hypothetical protein